MSLRPKTVLLLVLAGISPAWPALAAHNDPADVAAIGEVVERARTAILDKDRAGFLDLFVSTDPRQVNWRSVVDDAWLARVRATRPDARKARYLPEINHVSFIDSVVSSDASSEEVFDNIRIEADGEIAAVDFDYAFLKDGRQTNRGREMWQLLRTEAGWKIVSVIWSVRDPAE